MKETPFKLGTETVVKLSREQSRSRRLEAGEEERLLPKCSPHLRALVEAALEAGCRKGELLSLQWAQVRLDETKPELFLPAQKTKTKRDRRIPISSRLKAILEMRRNDPDGEPMPPGAYVFGNEIGQRVISVKTAWRLACKRGGIAIYTSTTSGARRGHAGWMVVCHYKRCAPGSDTRISHRRRRISRARSKGSMRPCDGLKKDAERRSRHRRRLV